MRNTIDEALERLAPFGPDLANGLTNHAPMAAEALCRLGRHEAVLPWIERYAPGMMSRPPRVERIGSDWPRFLGRTDRTTDWMALVEEELREASWLDVVVKWADRLAPAICASAMHGVIRVGHAVRSLEDAETPLRRRELAEALGYWAACYQTLPDSGADAPAMRARSREAIANVARVPPEERKFAGTIVSSLEALADFAPFAGVASMIDAEGDPSETISELTETFARVLVANAHDVLGAIVFVHGVTGLTAIRSLLPVLDPEPARRMVRYGWQASAALYATFGSALPNPDDVELPADVDSLVDAAVAHGDEHAIKLTEACVREHAIRPSAAYLAAARRAIELLPRA
jgi:questin oxidase-like protein